MALILSFLALVPRALLGFCAAHWIWRSSGDKHLLIKVFLAVPLGVGLSSLAGFLWIWIGFPLSAYAFAELGAAAAFTLYTAWRDRQAFLQVLRARVALSGSDKVWLLLGVMGVAVFAGSFFIAGWQNPHGRSDAWTNWNVAARFIYRGGESWQATFRREYDHPDYPLLLSMSNATTWTLIGRDYVRAPMALGFLFAGSTLGLLFAYLNLLKGGAQATLAMLIPATQPGIAYQAMTQMSDSPEAAYFLASAGLIPVYFLLRDRRIAVLAGVLAGLSAWTKNEGLTFMLLSGLAWGLIAFFNKDNAFRPFVFGLAFPAAVVLLFQVLLAPTNDLFLIERDISILVRDLQRYMLIFAAAGRSLLDFGEGFIGAPILMFAYAVLVGKSARPAAGLWPVLLLVSIQLVIYFGVYVVTPYDLVWHLRTSLDRLYTHVFPLCVLCLFAWLAAPEELAGKR